MASREPAMPPGNYNQPPSEWTELDKGPSLSFLWSQLVVRFRLSTAFR